MSMSKIRQVSQIKGNLGKHILPANQLGETHLEGSVSEFLTCESERRSGVSEMLHERQFAAQ